MLRAGFIGLTILVALLFLAGLFSVAGNTITDARKLKWFKVKAIIFLFLWLEYITIASLKGVFISTSLPPHLPLLLVLPAFAFIAFFFISGSFKNIITNTPARWLIQVQSFRIVVEVLLVSMFIKGMLPKAATLEGYNFDIIIGLLAPLIGWLAYANLKPLKPLIIAYNVAGLFTLGVVIFIVMTHAYRPAMWGLSHSILPDGLGLFPFTFLAGFLMPFAVFMHIFSLVKTLRPSNTK